MSPALPPGPRFAPLQTLLYMRDPHAYYDRMQRRYGDLFSMPAMNGQLVVTLSPEGAKEMLAGRESDFDAGFGSEVAAPIIGPASLLLSAGDEHQQARKRLAPSFHGRRLRAYVPAVAEAVRHELATWIPGRRFRLRERMEAISLEVIVRTVFGAQTPDRVAVFRRAIREAVLDLNPAPLFFRGLQRELLGLGPWARFLRRMRRFDALVDEQIQEARRHPGGRGDVLGVLLAAGEEGRGALSDREIRDHLVTLLVAGHETTATTLSWVFYELARHPAWTERLRGELAGLGEDPEALAGLPAVDAVCREALRLHPILAEVFRTVREGFDFQGWRIPAGVTLAASALKIHENPGLFPEPRRFRPERFLEQPFAPWEFIAFGGGHRHCIGAAFAMQEMAIVLGTVLPRVDLELAVDRPLRTVRRNLTLAPEGGVPMVVRRRLDARPARAA